MSVGYALLGLLSGGECHGYDLKLAHDARFPAARPLAFGQVYATIQRLLRAGWVMVGSVDQAGGPERTRYALTPAGSAELERWLAEPEAPLPFVANALWTKVTVALLVGDETRTRAMLARQRGVHLERMRYFTKVKTSPGAPIAQVLAADYAIAHLNADLVWIDTTIDRVGAIRVEMP